jgi:tetratricopeptide (TPR) repeat protein
LALFDRFAAVEASEAVPESAFFAAYWAGRGIGDAVLNSSSGSPSLSQLAQATDRYQAALELFPFEARVWSSLALGLERQGREDDFLSISQPIAEVVERSSALDGWIQQGREASISLDAMRGALADDLAIMYLGFAGAESLPELEEGLGALLVKSEELEQRRIQLESRLADLGNQRGDSLAAGGRIAEVELRLPPVSAGQNSGAPAGFAGGSNGGLGKKIVGLNARLRDIEAAQQRVAQQVEARSRALPLFTAALEAKALARSLGIRRDHPAHQLLRRMQFENR